jgi:hypothetical protein
MMEYCPKAFHNYFSLGSTRPIITKRGWDGIDQYIFDRSHNDELVKDEDKISNMEILTNCSDTVIKNLQRFKGPGKCDLCDDIRPKKNYKKFREALDIAYRSKEKEYNVLKRLLYFTHMMNKEHPDMFMDEGEFITFDVDNPLYRQMMCTLTKDITKDMSLRTFNNLIQRMWVGPDGCKRKDDIGERTFDRLENNEKIKDFDTAITMLTDMVEEEIKREDCYKSAIKSIRTATSEIVTKHVTQAEMIKKEYDDHMRLFPKTIPKDELDIERIKFINESAKRHKELNPDGIDEILDLTGIDAALVYHCLKDSRGETSEDEKNHFKSKYSLEI